MPDLAPLLIFAALEKLRQIPLQFWINLGLCALALIMVVRFWRALREINSFMPWLATMIAAAMILSYWTYNRNEPRFLTPFVDKLTLVLPTKAKHDADLERLRRSRD
ncbi:MAG: hypothetical protein R3F03_07225 [Opitutaceae bacterium]